ncbi:hypothetical protein E2C01_039909 [Portunus trituberculatus]|uniref:Uncharacterized protein n=1 Tax=Portunus trituberculatus TaxID=210409 RepID=A0A5B7FLF8_PORTR|nr:hypothetical protein [Portunus trituberculatus]
MRHAKQRQCLGWLHLERKGTRRQQFQGVGKPYEYFHPPHASPDGNTTKASLSLNIKQSDVDSIFSASGRGR